MNTRAIKGNKRISRASLFFARIN